MKVFVYWNFNKKMWSIRSLKTKRIIGYRNNICLVDCTLKVSEAGRQRVLRERRKNVHAGVIGKIMRNINAPKVPITYNPYKYQSFINLITGKPIYNANIVCMNANGRCMAQFGEVV